MISYLLPTRNRHQRLHQTLERLAALSADAHEGVGGAEIIVIDNGSEPPVNAPPTALDNGLPRRIIHLRENRGAAARNIGAQHARGDWLIMLDDDSYPLDCGHIHVLLNAPANVAAIGGEILLPDGSHEAGGLPEVIIGCGAAIRRDAFLAVGGYDEAFDYYAEEYDLCAKLLLAGWRIEHDFRFRVRHEKIATGRDMNRILHRLVRNNSWAAQRYATGDARDEQIAQTIERYATIAVKEQAAYGFAQGMTELLQTLPAQPQRTMPREIWDRFTGLHHAREWLARQDWPDGERVAVVEEGKNGWAVRAALLELGIELVDDARDAEVVAIGTLSPGPMLDGWGRWRASGKRVLIPWLPGGLVGFSHRPHRSPRSARLAAKLA